MWNVHTVCRPPGARRGSSLATAPGIWTISTRGPELAVELDGRAAHPPEQRWADSKRDNAHAALGILTVRYNWADVTTRPCLVAAEVAALLRQRGTAVMLRPLRPGLPRRLFRQLPVG